MTRKEWLTLTLIVAWLMGVALNAAVPTTFVTGSLNLPSGSNPSNVTITLTPSQSFSVTDAGGLKYQVLAPTTYSVTNSGVLAMYVVPNTGANNYPDWTTYTAEIKSSGRVVATQTWQLASSTLPVTVANIITSSTVTTTPTNALPLAGGTMLGPITLGSNSSQAGIVWPPSTAPNTAPEGATYIDSVTGKMNIRFGGIWVPPLATAADAAQTVSSTRKITTTAALPIGTAAAGTGIDVAAGDHVHGVTDGSLALSKLANQAQYTVVGRVASGSGAPSALTAAQQFSTLVAPVGNASGGYVSRPSGSNALLFAQETSNIVWCFESSTWVPKLIPGGGIITQAVGLSNNTDYYLYVYDNAGTLTLDLSTTASVTQSGVPVKSGATSRTLVARCRSNGTGAITSYVQDASTQLINNVYNKRRVSLFKGDTTDSWNYTTNTFRQANAATANKIAIVCDGSNSISSMVTAFATNANNVFYAVGIGLDSTSVNSANIFVLGSGSTAGANTDTAQAFYEGVPSGGFHELVWLEKSVATGTTTWFGDNTAGAMPMQAGITAVGFF